MDEDWALKRGWNGSVFIPFVDFDYGVLVLSINNCTFVL